MSSFIFQKGLPVRSVIIRRAIGTVISVTGILLLDFLVINAERRLDLLSFIRLKKILTNHKCNDALLFKVVQLI